MFLNWLINQSAALKTRSAANRGPDFEKEREQPKALEDTRVETHTHLILHNTNYAFICHGYERETGVELDSARNPWWLSDRKFAHPQIGFSLNLKNCLSERAMRIAARIPHKAQGEFK